MCRNIKPLFNFEPEATEDEIRNASLQFVRKLTGFQKPSKENEACINKSVNEITAVVKELFNSLETQAKPKNREEEAMKSRLRNEKRFGKKAL